MQTMSWVILDDPLAKLGEKLSLERGVILYKQLNYQSTNNNHSNDLKNTRRATLTVVLREIQIDFIPVFSENMMYNLFSFIIQKVKH